MRPISFNGTTFASLNLQAWIARGLPGEERQPRWLTRSGAGPLRGGVGRGGRAIPIAFAPKNAFLRENASGKTAEEDVLLRLLSILDAVGDEPATLVAAIDRDTNQDGIVETTTTVQLDATVGSVQWSPGDAKTLLVTFFAVDATWREQTDTVDTANAITTSGASFTVANGGLARADPLFKVRWTTQRTTESATVGWKWRKTVTVTNDETRTEPRETKTIDLGDTAAIVAAGKALANGNDLRVRLNGRELPRTLANWNTKRTFCYVAVTIPAGEARTLEIVYGNPDATAPFTLAEQGQARNRPERFSAIDQNHINGTATSGGASSLTDSTQTTPLNRWRGGFIQIMTGTGAGQRRKIDSSSTTTTYTVTRPWATTPDATSVYVVWMSGLYVNGGVASSGTSTTLTDSSQVFGGNELIGGTITIVSGTGSGQSRTITSNTATVVTVTTAWTTNPDSTSVYHIERQGFHIYYVEQETKRSSTATATLPRGDVWTGGWFQDARFSPPSVVMKAADGIANAWDTWLLRRNNDDVSNASTFRVDVGGGDLDNFNGLDADRRVGSDRTLVEEGIADGVTITNPHGYDAIFFDYNHKNPNGVATFVVLARGDGGGEWATVVEDSTARATLTPVAAQWTDLTGVEVGSPLHLYMGNLPKNPDENADIPSTANPNDVATVRWYRRLELFLKLANWSIGTLSAEEAIYDLNARLKLAALAADPPYGQIEFGGDGHHIHVPSGQEAWVRIDPDTTEPIIGLYTAAGVLVAETPWAAVVYRYLLDIRGNAVATVDRTGGELPPGNTEITVIEESIGSLEIDVVFRQGYVA